ncbi:MAG: hypothetical protein G01um10148_750 [Parcubacteria group bacterium Gr01-1014_8]|nr:MAG: hypothetical protein G01um10148_750 [Parcubacteria group bacterium Gr01-1014_8]
MPRIIFGLIVVAGAAAAIGAGMTGAFFSDTETSTGNTFAAGAIDLKIDNDSYYNGNRCTFLGEQATTTPGFYWQGQFPFPLPGSPCDTSFPLSDLDDGLLFFNFTDLKPDDEGEDTISIHVQNDAWACMDLTLTSDDDVSTTEPEGQVDAQENPLDAWDGELADALQFFWWADDGDNVYETGEQGLSGGVKTLTDLATTTGAFSITLADSNGNAWGGDSPLPANETVYIAKAWCFGTLTTPGLPDDADTGPQVRPNSVLCDGTALGNETQTDMAELTLAFRAEQARHNEGFLCNPPEVTTGTLTVNKALLVSTVGIEVADFTLHIVGPGGDQVVTDEVPVPGLPSGSYTAYEQVTGNVGGKTFTVTFSGACTNSVNVGTSSPFTLNPSDNLTCNILNNEVGDGIQD